MAAAEHWIRTAAARGAQLVATPENTTWLGSHTEKLRRAEAVDGPTHRRFAALAAELRIHLLIGSVAERVEGFTDRCANTSLFYGPDGALVASYRKLHLFDVDAGPDLRFRESATTLAGDAVVVVPTPVGPMGLSICYDLRFPELYAAAVRRGAVVLSIPAAFTARTGKDHWEPLLRARAIETQCWVLAPGQQGHHDDDGLRESHGHSMIVDPWGHVVARCSDGPGIAMAPIDAESVARIRRAMPLSEHRRYDAISRSP